MYFLTTEKSPMSLGDLKRLIKTGEGTYLEFKRTISDPLKIARELCAFANTKGGMLLIGVDDNKTVTGVDSFDEEQFDLAEAIALCEPDLNYTIETVETGLKEVVVVKVEESAVKPVIVNFNGKKHGYERERDKSVRLSREKTHIMKQKGSLNGIRFRYGPNEQRLFSYLNEYGKISVQEYSNLIDVSEGASSRILVDLVSIGVLKLYTHQDRQYFMLTNKVF